MKLVYPDKQIDEPEHANKFQQPLRKKEVRNLASKNKCVNECQRIMAIWATKKNTPWDLVDIQVKSHIILSLRE